MWLPIERMPADVTAVGRHHLCGRARRACRCRYRESTMEVVVELIAIRLKHGVRGGAGQRSSRRLR